MHKITFNKAGAGYLSGAEIATNLLKADLIAEDELIEFDCEAEGSLLIANIGRCRRMSLPNYSGLGQKLR